MKVTRKDVAKYAGVSEQTVSYVLNNSRKFSDDVVKRVKKAIKDLNYQPDMIAKSMSQKQTKSVAIFIRDMGNPIFPAIIHGFQKKAFEKGYSVYIADTEGCQDVDFLIASLISRRVDGVYISMFSDNDFVRIVNVFQENGIKVVIGNEESRLCDVPSVTVDFEDGMKQIVRYLHDCGHEKIVYLSGIDTRQKNDNRYDVFCKEYRALFGREPVVIENEAPYATTVESGKQLVEKLFAVTDDFTAIVTTNDLMAYGVIDALKQKNKRIPEDISVIGIDDIMFSKYINPPLTTLGYNNQEFGAKTFKVLMKSIQGKDAVSIKESCYIVERGTVKKIKDV
jgi:DNA-binding LacI/PurR family transcriptional regulator